VASASPSLNNSDELISYVPGELTIDLVSSKVHEFLAKEPGTPLLDEIYPRLFLVARKSSNNIEPLRRQAVKGLDIVPADDPKLHLVSHHSKIYIKPTPVCLLNYHSWDLYMPLPPIRLSHSSKSSAKEESSYQRWTVPQPFANFVHVQMGTRDNQLAAEGPYSEKIRKLTGKYPNLQRPDINRPPLSNIWNDTIPKARTAVFNFDENGQCSPRQFRSLNETSTYLNTNTRALDACTRELWLLEGLDPTYVALFGHALEVDPLVFIRHRNNGLWQWRHQAGCTPLLPSLVDFKHSFQLKYRELRFFPGGIDRFRLRCVSSNRHVGATCFNEKFDHVGIVERRVTFWARDLPHGGWQGNSNWPIYTGTLGGTG
jgi:hypothetical protein